MKHSEAIAVVTGAASGLGRATAEHFVARGGRVALMDLPNSQGEAVAKALGVHAMFVAADVTKEAEVDAAFARVVEKFGHFNVLVNCAGVGPAARTLGKNGPHPADLFARTVDINLIGTFTCIRLAAARMRGNTPNEEGERGVIVNTASVAAYDGQLGQAAYAASKGGVVSMTLPIARDLADTGIRVMTIAPGLFETPLFAQLPEKVRESLAQQTPFPKRLGRPYEYAALVGSILENTMLNAETIRIDGGLRLAPR